MSSDPRSGPGPQNHSQAKCAKTKTKKRKIATSLVGDTMSMFIPISEANMSCCVLLSMSRSKSPPSELSVTPSFFFDIQNKDRCLFFNDVVNISALVSFSRESDFS